MMTTLAKLSDVTYGYNRRVLVVRELSATFEAGMVSAVSGRSGCGKSTVLSLLGLLLKPRAGSVTIMGVECTNTTDRQRSLIRRRHIGFVFQDAMLETSMTVWNNLVEALPPGANLRSMRSAAAAALESVNLSPEILDRKALALSGGQAQRVAVVRALLKQPTLVLADEPTGNLDDQTSETVLKALFEYARGEGRGCVIATHDQRIVERADNSLRVGP
jgi:lipoprotein-releasing system ATP-binding protein